MKERELKFDIAKALAAYLVVLGHMLGQIAGKNIYLISYCHMPVFFWVSGYFLNRTLNDNRGGYKRLITKKIYRLLIPYLVWSAISLAANLIMQWMIEGELTALWIRDEFAAIFIYARSVWFLPEIFFSEFLCIVVWYVTGRKKCIGYVLLAFVWLAATFVSANGFTLIYKFQWLFPFLLLGMICREYEDRKNGEVKKMQTAMRLAGFLFVPLALLTYRERYFSAYSQFAYSDLQSILAGSFYFVLSCMSICLIMWISEQVEKMAGGKWLALAGGYSMEIYVIHMFGVKFMRVVPDRIAGSDILIYIYYGLYAFVLTALIVLFARFIEKRSSLFCRMVGRQKI